MPNWSTNYITFRSEDDAKRVRELMTSSVSEFDFERILPVPESLSIKESSKNYPAIVFYLTDRGRNLSAALDEKYFSKFESPNADEGLARATRYIAEDADGLYELGRRCVENVDKHGFRTWYGWCNKNWGSKWNASDIGWFDDLVGFQTPWDPPFPVLEKIAELLDIEFDLRFYLEGDGDYECTVAPTGCTEPVCVASIWDDIE